MSSVVFFGAHAFARKPPRSMTKEWQEATNEYLKVGTQISLPRPYSGCSHYYSRHGLSLRNADPINRKKNRIRSMALPVKATPARAMFRASQQNNKELSWIPMNRDQGLALRRHRHISHCTCPPLYHRLLRVSQIQNHAFYFWLPDL